MSWWRIWIFDNCCIGRGREGSLFLICFSFLLLLISLSYSKIRLCVLHSTGRRRGIDVTRIAVKVLISVKSA